MAADPGKLLGAVVAYCSNLYNLICVLAPTLSLVWKWPPKADQRGFEPTLSDIVGFAVAPKADQSRFQPLDFGFWRFWGFWIVFCRVLTSEKIFNLLSCPNCIRYSWLWSGPQRQTRADSSLWPPGTVTKLPSGTSPGPPQNPKIQNPKSRKNPKSKIPKVPKSKLPKIPKIQNPRKVVLKKTCFCWRDAPSTVVWALKSTDTNTATLPIKASQFRIIPENTFHYPLPTILNGLISILELGYSYCSNLYNLICLLAPTLSDIVGFPVAPKADQSRFQPLDFAFWRFWGFWIVFCRVLTSEKILNLLWLGLSQGPH